MARAYRWAYMSQPNFNPPNNDCPECSEPSRTYSIGGRTENGTSLYTYRCEHNHTWTTTTQLNTVANV